MGPAVQAHALSEAVRCARKKLNRARAPAREAEGEYEGAGEKVLGCRYFMIRGLGSSS
jgi:hypothetical protein